MKRQPKIAIFGAGSIGTRHAVNLASLGVADIAFWEPEAKSQQRAAEKTPAVFLESRDAFWEWNPDAVFICTPSAQHLRDVTECVERGKDVFVEKPLATSLEGCRSLAAKADLEKKVTMVACNMRFHAGPATIKHILETDKLGAIFSARLHTGSYLPNWRPWQDYRSSYSADPQHGGAVLDCIHEIDLALWMFGPASLGGGALTSARSLGLATEGAAELLLRHRSGLISTLHLNYMQRDYRRYCQIMGTEGSLYWDFSDASIRIFGTGGTLIETIGLPPPGEVNEMYLGEIKHFLDCLELRQPSCNPLSSGTDALEIALAARALPR